MKVISWNVNGIRAVEKKGFESWLLGCGADVVCIQETKARPWQLGQGLLLPGSTAFAPADFPMPQEGSPCPVAVAAPEPKEAQDFPYASYWSYAQKPGYSGTALYTRVLPDKVECLGDSEYDSEGRVTSAFFGKTAVISAYFPNSQGPGLRLDYKLGFCKALLSYCDRLVGEGYDTILCGDYNIAHTPIDLANPKSNEGNAGYLPEEREWMTHFLQSGYTDTFRMFCKEGGHYSWWSYRFHAREKNIGWRIDYCCVNSRLAPRVKSAGILPQVPGSDHCPVFIEI